MPIEIQEDQEGGPTPIPGASPGDGTASGDGARELAAFGHREETT
jgi:hypothetical protein